MTLAIRPDAVKNEKDLWFSFCFKIHGIPNNIFIIVHAPRFGLAGDWEPGT